MSDSSSKPLATGLVVGTAGHIDHGKTSLVRALTGIDTDRLAEEKRRGISIDLGFAHLNLPNGRTASFIDVPGHERFIKNMLAGAAGIEAVMLIVAANESVMPQTREHFEICRLLRVRHGFVVLTKTDLASPEQIVRARADVQHLCAGSFLENAPVVECSAATKAGLQSVIEELVRLSESIAPRQTAASARLPVDRSFSLTGFGTVVTGTLFSGQFRVGESVTLHPGQRQARIRGIQVHGKPAESASAGQRTAINLSGIESGDIQRGFTLTHADSLTDSTELDVSIEWLGGEKAPARKQDVLFHAGTAELVAKLKMFDERAGRVSLSAPVLALPGDRFILRRPSPAQTIAGGVVVDSFPVPRLNRAKMLARIRALREALPAERVRILVEEATNGRELAALTRLTGFEANYIQSLIRNDPNLFLHASTGRVFSKHWLGTRRAALIEWLHKFHKDNPSAVGAPVSAARMGLAPEIATVVTDGFPAVRVQGDFISLAAHRAVFNDQESRALSNIESAFRTGGYQPPPVEEVLRLAPIDLKKGRALLELLIKNKRLIRISEDLIFHVDVIQHVRSSLSSHRGRRFSVPEFKDWTQMSRKYAIPVLEYLDREKVTRRDGDYRVII